MYSNTRNLAAGSIRQLDPSIASSRKLRLFIHGVSDPSSFLNYKTLDAKDNILDLKKVDILEALSLNIGFSNFYLCFDQITRHNHGIDPRGHPLLRLSLLYA